MKNYPICAIIIAAIISCKKESTTNIVKDYTCECKDGNGNIFDQQTYPRTQLQDATDNCDEREDFWKNTTTPSADCDIK